MGWNQNIWTELLFVQPCSGCPRDLKASPHLPTLAALQWFSVGFGAAIKSLNGEQLWQCITIQRYSRNSRYCAASRVVKTNWLSQAFLFLSYSAAVLQSGVYVVIRLTPSRSLSPYQGQEIIVLSCLSGAFSLFLSLSARKKFREYGSRTEWKTSLPPEQESRLKWGKIARGLFSQCRCTFAYKATSVILFLGY